ncbi:hypothetical protein [Bacillus massiliigorillae]|uniref:hypothetical protein n=1 Tax=Bacillus massiliigorillae TaxID=1243664 RepID=UPI0003A22433|nr:hypothetical protein [Bacillus massiliigorillae]
MNAIIKAIIHKFKHHEKEKKPYDKQSVNENERKDKSIVKKELLDPELYRYAQGAVIYMYQTTLLIPDVDGIMYEKYKSKYMKKNQIFPSDVNGELMKEIKLLDVYFNTFLLSKQGIERGYDFSEEEIQKNIENVILQCMEIERRFGINYMSATA